MIHRNPIYFFYSLLVIALSGYAMYSGWSMTRYDEVRDVPKSVRENPGVYRSHYRSHPRYFGGK